MAAIFRFRFPPHSAGALRAAVGAEKAGQYLASQDQTNNESMDDNSLLALRCAAAQTSASTLHQPCVLTGRGLSSLGALPGGFSHPAAAHNAEIQALLRSQRLAPGATNQAQGQLGEAFDAVVASPSEGWPWEATFESTQRRRGAPALSTSKDEELYSDILRVDGKVYFVDLKTNVRGKYVKISEKANWQRSTLVVPEAGIAWFRRLFEYYASNGHGAGVKGKELVVGGKTFAFDVVFDARSSTLRITESAGSVAPHTQISVPAASADGNVWVQFYDALLQAEAHAFGAPLDDIPPVGAEAVVGPGHTAPDATAPHAVQAGSKRFFFNVSRSRQGDQVKITEVEGVRRTSLVVPAEALSSFHHAMGRMLEGMGPRHFAAPAHACGGGPSASRAVPPTTVAQTAQWLAEDA